MIVYSCLTNEELEICMDCVNLNDCSVVHLSNEHRYFSLEKMITKRKKEITSVFE